MVNMYYKEYASDYRKVAVSKGELWLGCESILQGHIGQTIYSFTCVGSLSQWCFFAQGLRLFKPTVTSLCDDRYH